MLKDSSHYSTLWDSSTCPSLLVAMGSYHSLLPGSSTIPASTVWFQIMAQFTQRLWITFFKDFFEIKIDCIKQLSASEPPSSVFLSLIQFFLFLQQSLFHVPSFNLPSHFYTTQYQNVHSWKSSSANWGDTSVCHENYLPALDNCSWVRRLQGTAKKIMLADI